MLTNTTEIGTATLPRRRLTIPAPTDVSPSAPRRPPRFPALAWAALALLGLLAHPSPAAAQTDVWTATLTPADFGSGLLGCNNASATSKCSTATVLSDDDFTYDSTDYSVTTLYLNATAFTLTVDTDITAATNALTVVVGSTSLAFAAAIQDTARTRTWFNPGFSWTAGTAVSIRIPDTTPPELTSAAVAADGNSITVTFDESVDQTNLPAAGAFSVAADGAPVTVSGVSAGTAAQLVLALAAPGIRAGQVVTLGYTDPTAGDDTSAVQDTSGNDAVSFSDYSVTNNSIVVTVPSDWSLKPTGLAVGDQFRLLFLSSTKRDGSSTDIATYNTFIQTRAAAGHADIRTYSTGFRAVGCTADTDARDTTYTTYTSTDKGVPIYWLNGAKAADQYEDFYDGTWDDEVNDKNESGTNGPNTSLEANYPLTGCNDRGTEYFDRFNRSSALAEIEVMVGRPNSSAAASHGPLSSNTALDVSNTVTRPMYGLSAIFQVAADTTPPTLTGASIEETDGLIINLVFSEDLQLSNPPPVSAFTVTVDGSAATVSSVLVPGSLLPQNDLWLQLSTAIRQGQAVVVAYADPTTGDDANAIQDTAGNDAADFTTGMSGVPAVTNNSTVTNTVPSNWTLKPTALAAGAKFRLLFLSSTKRNATATNIATYNTFVQTRAAAGHADIRDYSAGFRVVGCTAAVDARDNTATTYTTSDKGVPIYWLNGAKAADQYEDFYDGSWDDEANDKNESGTNGPDTSQNNNLPYTGCSHDGTELTTFGASRALGAAQVSVGRPNSSGSGNGPLFADSQVLAGFSRPLYGLSAVFQVAAAVVVPNNPPTVATAIPDQTATAGTAFSYAFPDTTFSDADTGDTLTYTATKADDTALPTWLAFAAGTRTFSGTPQAADTGTVSVKVTASDGNGGSVSDAFDITVAADTTPPTLTSADVEETDELAIYLEFSEDLQLSNPPPASTFTLTVDGSAVTGFSVAWPGSLLPQNSIWLQLSTAIRQGQAVVVTYTDPTAGDDTLAIQDTAGNDAADFTTGMDGVPAVTNNSTVTNTPATGAPTITGTAQVGQVLTATVGTIADVDGLPNPFFSDAATTIAWIRVATDNSETNIAAATASTYTLVAADLGTTVKVRVSFTDDASNAETLTSAATAAVSAAANTPATGAPTITGTAQVGQTLTAGTTAIMDADGLTTPSYTYQWIRVDGGTETNISGATASTYTLVAADLGTTVKVRVSFTDDASNAETLTSAATAAVSAAANTPATGAPTITGTAQVGQTLTAGTTAIVDADGLTTPSYTYQWIRVATDNSETNIASATASTYTLVDADLGTTIKVRVSFTDDASNTETLTSAATAAVSAAPNTPATGAPTITGTAQVGQTLTAGTTAIMDDDGLTSVSYTYQWIRTAAGVETNIAAATASTYTLVAADLGTTVKVRVSFTDDASNAETLTSAATAAVSAAANTPATGAPTITGTAQVGQTLTAGTTAIVDADGLTTPSYTYQWIRVATDNSETNIASATASTYTLVAADLGTTIKVRVSFTDDASNTETLTSAATAAVTDTTGQTTVTFGASSYTATEGGAAAAVTVALSAAPSASVTIPLTTAHLNGATAADHAGIPATVTFGTNQTVMTFTVTATDDADTDGGESVQLGFGTLPAGYAPGARRTATVTLVDDDANLIVNFGTERHTTVKVLESDTVWHRFIFSLSTSRDGPPNGNPQQPVTIPLVVTHVGGATPADYEVRGRRTLTSVTFEVGQSVTDFSMRAIPDGKREPGEGLRLDFGPLPAGVRKGTWGPYETIAFVDQVLPGYTVLFGAEAYTATEGGAPARVSIHLSEPVEIEPLVVRLVVTHVGATAADYEGIPKSVRFGVGEQTQTITVTATDDTDDDDGESVTLSFVNDPNGRVRVGTGPASATVALADNDGLRRVTVSFGAVTYTATEGGGGATVRVELDAAPGRSVTVPLTKAHLGNAMAADYSGIPMNVTFAANQTSRTFAVMATAGDGSDGGESVSIGFGTLPEGVFAGSPAATTVTLADGGEQRLVVNFGSSRGHTVQVREGARRLRLNVLLDSSPRRPVTIPLVVTHVGGATEADYAAIPESVTFAAGQTSAHYYVRALPDEEDKTGEGLQLDVGPLPPGVRKGTWGPYETIDFLDPDPTALLPAFAAFRLLTSGNASAQDSVESDRAVLEALYNATDGPNWTGNTHWLSNEPLSEWRGVGVNDDGRVTALWLFGNQLTGEIPVELSQLSQLQLLYLSSNQLTGEIPVELSQLSQLQDLYLDSNQLTGEIPVELSQLSQLQLLYLYSNRLTGEIPAELGDLAQLNGLYLHGNELNGPVPSWLVNLTELRELSLWSNQLTGTIPPEVAPAQDRAALVVLYLQTDGPNWTDNTNWARSREPLSEWHGVSTDEQGRVEELRLSANGLNGTIGAELGVLTRLTGLYLNDNELTGTIPPELENLTQLQVFDIRNTGLCVTADSELHTWIATIQDFQGTATCGASNLVANFVNGNNGAFNSRVYLWNPSESSGDVTVRVFTLPLTGGLAQELTAAPLNLGTLGAKSALNVKVAEDILAPLGIALPYTNNEGDLTLEFTIQAVDVRGATQVFSSSLAFGTHPLQEIPSTSSGSPTVLVANFVNGNTDAFSSRAYLFNPSDSDGNVTVRVFTLPLSDGTAQELTGTPLDLGTLEARSALNLKLAEDILTPLGITTPYTTDGGNLTLEFTIEVADVRGAAQVFSSSFAFGVYPLQEIPSTSSGSPTVLVANFMNGNSDAFISRAYLFNPSDSDGTVTVRVFTLPQTGNSSLLGTLDLGSLQAESARNLKLAEDILAPLGIALPYVTDGGNLTLEFTIQAADARGVAQVFSSDFAFGTYPMQEIPSTSSESPTVLVANFMNGNDAALNSRVYL